ncbi:MAG: DNA translocase FtsK [Clostridia bacterium]|nr:DNA translocase FtsK [Clostridia bacterium]
MAARKSASTKRKASSKKEFALSTQVKSVILFAVAVLFACMVFIEGQNLWTIMHNFVLSLFGFTAYIIPFILGAIAIIVGIDKEQESFNAKVIESIVLLLILGAVIDVFRTSGNLTSPDFAEHITSAYESGLGGGLFGAVIGGAINLAFGKIAAAITLIILGLVFLMIVTGTTLISVFKTMSKPVKAVSMQAENAYKDRALKEQNGKEYQKGDIKVIKGFDVDVPIDEEPKKRRRKILQTADSADESKQKLLDIYNDVESENGETSLNNAIDYAKSEDMENKEELGAIQKIKVDFEKETAEVLDEISQSEKIVRYKYPPYELLKKTNSSDAKGTARELDITAEKLVEVLRSFGVETRVLDISRGPTVTRYELQPCAGVKISKITGLADDIALNLAAAGVRIEAPIPNKAAVGIEVPNKASAMVGVREIIESSTFSASKSKLTVAMGRDIGGNVIIGDIAKMPHGLIAGATGSGKSVCINSIIMSILYKASPEDVKLLMIDPKVVELGVYNGIPHLLVPVVTDPRKAAGALGWAVTEMEKRYTMFADRGVRDIEGYNRFVQTLTDEPEVTKMPHIVIIIDELADLMMTAPSEVEDSINRIAAKARAAGMHLLIATQRPSVDVVTGVIKANIPTRIAFAVSSQVDSRTILDAGGAEKLLGKGDMLFSPIGSTKPKRVQGCFVSDGEVEKVVDFVKKSASANYDDNIMVEIERQAALEKQKKTGLAEDAPDSDPMIEEAVKVAVEMGTVSTSLLQRKLKLGYARAARIVDELETRGIVGPYEGSKPRKVLITKEQLMEQQATKPDVIEEV